MSLSLFVRKAVICTALAAAFPGVLSADSRYITNGAQYAIAGALPGDQAHPRIAMSPVGGFAVWEDNRTDGDGLGISAQRLDAGLSGKFSTFQVNEVAAGDQERPQVALLKDGGAVFVWQGGKLGSQHIYARFLAPDNTWRTGDVLVSDATKELQVNPIVTTLMGGNVVIVYTSLNQYAPTSMKDVYGQMFTPQGAKVGSEFLVNQFTAYNQRTPSVAALANGGFVVVWISEQQRTPVNNPAPGTVYASYMVPSVDVYARAYSSAGSPVGNEVIVNSPTFACANPVVAAADDGSYTVAWSEKDTKVLANGWDIFTRHFNSLGVGSQVARGNTQTLRDQYDPQISASGSDYFLVWNSKESSGLKQSVYGQFLNSDGTLSGTEFQVNSVGANTQVQPAVATDGAGRFLVAWAGFTSVASGSDIYSQRYFNAAQPLTGMGAPFVYVPYQMVNGAYVPQVQVSWPEQAGIPVDHYEIYINGSSTPTATLSTNVWLASNLQPSTAYSFAVAYVTADGRRSAPSPATQVTTWSNYNWSGIPFEWMNANYGADFSLWPGASSELAPGGLTLAEVFISGGNPKDSTTWLRSRLENTAEGLKLNWNPQPGRIYQVQTSSDLVQWTDVGGKRFAAGTADNIPVANGSTAYYRVVLMR